MKAEGPLQGYRIVEFCSTLAGPMATMLMGDQGAEVIKIEPPAGDQGRQVGASRKGVSAMATMFVNVNRNKRSIVLDLKDPADLETARALAASADVVVQSYRPGVMERLGLGYAELRKRREDLIYLSISGLGNSGEGRDRRVYDVVVQGLAGFASVQADRETGEPRTVQNAITDKITALVVWQAATAALLHRERSGQGQEVDVSMLSAALSFLWPETMPNISLLGEDLRRTTGIAGVRYVFATADGHIIAGFVSNDEFAGLCRALELPELPQDPRFSSIAGRFQNTVELNTLLAARLLEQPSAIWLARLAAEDAVFAPVNSAEDLADDALIRSADLLAVHEHPVLGAYRQPVHPVRFSASPAQHRRHPPLLGEHGAELRNELEEKKGGA